ncbi:MAG: hypothetical protein JJU20_05215 [Opitutales bacterium]|nr:hypothetical protein [Opitutales bacterium]
MWNKIKADPFRTSWKDVRIAQLKKNAPTLARTRSTSYYAVFGSFLALLTVMGFYYTVNIYQQALGRQDSQYDFIMEVEQAPEIKAREVDQAIERIEAEITAEEEAYSTILEDLRNRDLLGEEVPRIR